MRKVGRRGLEPDPCAVSDQAGFRCYLKQLMNWAGYGSLQQLEAGAERCGVSMPASTANRALNTDRLPTAEFVRRFVIACGGDVERWTSARDGLADLKYARSQPPAVGSVPPSLNRLDVCPYPGLAAFERDQERWFFGRKRATAELVRQLTERLKGTGPLIVVGSSGSGKSSLLRAGLLPAVQRGVFPGSRGWPCLLFTPTADPIRELANQVASLTESQSQAAFDELESDPGRLVDTLHEVLAIRADRHPTDTDRVVLVVDQFEETFTLCSDDHQRQVFIRALCAAATGANGSQPAALVVFGLRADFYGNCTAHPELVKSLHHGQVLLSAMSTTELRDAIEKPARAVGMELEPRLVEVMLRDLGVDDGHGDASYEPGALPLLSHALFATWQQRDGRILTLDGYRLSGEIRGAIATTAKRAYLGLDSAGQRIARQLLLRMIQIGDGAEDTRRRLDRHRLIDESAEPAAAEAVLERLASARLVTLDTETVEITHEALLRSWPRLREWIDSDRARLLVCQRLAEAADAWNSEGRHSSALYQGPRLATAHDWVDPADPDLTPLARDFLAASVQREHDEQRLARHRTGRLRQLVVGLAILLVLAITATVVAVVAREDAIRQRNVGISRRVAGEAIALRTINSALATQLSLAAFRLVPTAEARGGLISTFVSPDPTRLTSDNAADAVRSVAFSPDGRTMAAGSHDKTVRLLDVTDPVHSKQLPALRHADAVRSVAFSPDGRILATGSSDSTVRLWDVTDPRHPSESVSLHGHTDVVPGVMFSPDGRTLATGSWDKTARLWDVTDPQRPTLLVQLEHDDQVFGVAFSPDGHILATASAGKRARLWNVADPRHPRELASLSRHTGYVMAVAFSRDGHTLATSGSDTTARLWDISDPLNPSELAILAGHTAPVPGLAFSSDGHVLATASIDTTARLWDVTNLRHPTPMATPLAGHNDNVYSVAFSPDGHTLATASHDKTARLWEIDVDRIAARVCENADPIITRSEWDQYFPGLDYKPPCPSP